MLGSERRVAITGLGLVTPLGDSPDSVWTSVAEGRGMVRPLEAFRVAGLPNDAGAEIRDFDLKKYSLPKYWNALRKTKKYLARDIQLAVAAAQLAVVDAGSGRRRRRSDTHRHRPGGGLDLQRAR